MLLGSQRAKDVLSERLAFYVLDKVAHDADIDVRFEQRQAHLTERFLDIALGDSPLSLELLEDAFETVAEGIEHRSEPVCRGSGMKR
jgi:hypothetical protein